MANTRRQVLAGIGTTLVIGTGATQVLGQSKDTRFSVEEVNPGQEYVVFRNNTDEKQDLSGLIVAFQYQNSDYNQRRTIPDGKSVAANSTFTVATGARDVPDADVTFDYDHEGEVIDDDGTDIIALLDADGNELTTSDEAASTSTTTTKEETTSTSDSSEDKTTTTDETTEKETTSTTTEKETTTSNNSGSDSGSNTDSNTSTESPNGGQSSDSTNTNESTDDDC